MTPETSRPAAACPNCAALKADAMRYRWLRDNPRNVVVPHAWGDIYLSGKELDKMIDYALVHNAP